MIDGQTERYIVVNIPFLKIVLDVNETNIFEYFSKYPQTFPDKLFIAEGTSDRGTDIKFEQSNFAVSLRH